MSAQPGFPRAVVRAMRPSDIDAVVAIEGRAYAFPWSRGIFGDCLLAGYFAVVLDSDGEVVGYAIMSAAAAEGHILNLCVDEARRGSGFGRQLLNYLLDEAGRRQLQRLFLEVRPSNDAAVALYEDSGFTRLGVRKDYYRAVDGREDALVFVRGFG